MRRMSVTQRCRAAGLGLGALLILLPARASAAGEWTPVGPDGGTILDLAVAPSAGILFVGTRAGVFRSADGGAHWTAASAGLPLSEAAGGVWVAALAIDGGPPETIYASVLLHGVFASVDGGTTWQRASEGLVGTHAEQLVVRPDQPGTAFALTSAGIFRTTNGGAGWTKLGAFPTTAASNASVIAVAAGGTLFAGLPDQLLVTADGGQTWTRIDGPGFRGWRIDEIAVDPGAPGTLYVAAADFPTGAAGIFRSNDGGATWTSASAGLPAGKRALALAVDPETPGELYVALASSGVFASADGGAQWRALDGAVGHASALAIDPTAADTIYAVGSGPNLPFAATTGVFRSDDGGDHWEPRSRGIDAYELEAVVIDPKTPSTLYLRSLYHGILKSTDSGASWQAINGGLSESGSPVGVDMLAIDPVDPRVLYASVFGDGFFKTVDGGARWTPIATPGELGIYRLAVLHVDPVSPRTLLAATGDGVFRSLDAGASWHRLGGEIGLLGASGELFHFELVRDPASPGTLYAVGLQEIIGSPPRIEGTLFRSADRGATWTVVAEDFVYALTIAPGPPSVLYAYAGTEILASADGGAHWTPAGTTPKPIFRLLADPRGTGTLFAAALTGVLRSDDGGASWREWDEGLANVAVTDLAFDPLDPGRLYLTTRGGGLSTRLSGAEPCIPSATALCLAQGRFRVAVSWRDFAGRTGVGTARELTDDTGAFWFFAPGNIELTVKVLDGRALNGRFWVFYGALTNVEFTLVVTDTETGQQRVYTNPSGRFASIGDTGAF